MLRPTDVAPTATSNGVTTGTADDLPGFTENGGLREVRQTLSAEPLTVFDFRWQFPDAASAAAFLDASEETLSESSSGAVEATAPVGLADDVRYYEYELDIVVLRSVNFNYLMRQGSLVAKVFVQGVAEETTPEDGLRIATSAVARMTEALAGAPAPSASVTPSGAPPSVGLPTATASSAPPSTDATRLDYTLDPDYGAITLEAGFIPDPHTVEMVSGGPVAVSYLGDGCSGFASAQPDLEVRYTKGDFDTLRFYFTGDGDTTLIINGPTGEYVCRDDANGTLDPRIDFDDPASGTYDIWVGSYSPDASISGTLHITENTTNRP